MSVFSILLVRHFLLSYTTAVYREPKKQVKALDNNSKSEEGADVKDRDRVGLSN